MMRETSYVPLSIGVDLLRHYTSEIVWRGKSLFLCAGCEEVLPNFRFSGISDRGSETGFATAEGGFARFALAFEADENNRRWAAAHQVQLLMTPQEVVQKVGDKTVLPELLSRAGLRPIPGRVFEAGSRHDAERVWRELGADLVVVQRPENNLTGMGTRLILSQDELSAVLAEWSGFRLKVTKHLEGYQLTISGCVGRDQTIVSALSQQLVGMSPLTNFWGAHCGNQLIDPSHLAGGVADRCFDACGKVGDELRRHGFLGIFGLDLIQTLDGEVYVVEINPRLQSVTSLINVAEIASGRLPLPGVHLLSFLLEKLPAVSSADTQIVPPLSQVVLYARRRGTILQTPMSGWYRLGNGILRPTRKDHSLRSIPDDNALVWNFVKLGDRVQEDSRLAVLQTPVLLAQVGSESDLTDVALRWIEALERLYRIEE